MAQKRTVFQTFQFGLTIVRNPFTSDPNFGKYVAVNETRNRGWWIPGGAIDYGENFIQGAIRECKEEAGIDVQIKGILKVDHSVAGNTARMRVIFYAEPTNIDEAQKLKRVPDSESLEARWVNMEEAQELDADLPGLRGDDVLVWGKYLNEGGHIYPLGMFGEEGENQRTETSRSMTI